MVGLENVLGKDAKKLLKTAEEATLELMSFARTYIGIYNKNGVQEQKGDRDYFYEYFETIVKKLEEIEKRLEELEKKA